MLQISSFLRFSLIAVLLSGGLLVPARLPAQINVTEPQRGDIRGVVSDSATGERLPGVNLTVAGTKRGATTNLQGFYLLAGLPAGDCEVVASAVGYARRSFRVQVKEWEPVVLDIRLRSQVLEGKEVVVHGEAAVAALSERSASIHIMRPEELRHLPSAAGQEDLLRALQMLPGVTSTSDVSAKFYVRGGAGDQNLILLDGMKIYNPFHAFGLFSVLDPEIIKSAEVYTGAFPAGYGNRLSSVVNVTTRDGNLARLAGTANVNFLSGKLELEGPLSEDNSWLVSGRSSLFSGTINKLIPNPAPTTFYDLFFKGTAGTSTGRLGFRGYTSGDDIIPSDPTQPDHRWRNSAFSGVLSALVSERLYVDATVSYSRSEIQRLAKAGSSVTPASSKLQEAGLRVELTSFTEGETTFFEGFEFAFPQIDDVLYSPNLIPLSTKDSQVEWYIWSQVQGTALDGLLRYDLGLHGDIDLLLLGRPFFYGIQPRLTLTYMLSPAWALKASYGIFTQKLISVSNEDDLISLFDAWLYLPEELRPEMAEHYVAGLEGALAEGMSVSLQAYRKDYPSLALYNPQKVFPTDPDFLRGTGEAYGAELLVRYTSALLDLYASYGLSRVTLTQGELTYAPRYDRRHSVKAVGTVHLASGLDVTLHWEYGSGYPFTQGAGFYDRLSLADIGRDPFPSGSATPVRTLGEKNAERLPAYHRLDLGVNYRLTPSDRLKVTFGASVINLYDQKNILYFDRQTGKTDYMIPFFPTASLSVEF